MGPICFMLENKDDVEVSATHHIFHQSSDGHHHNYFSFWILGNCFQKTNILCQLHNGKWVWDSRNVRIVFGNGLEHCHEMTIWNRRPTVNQVAAWGLVEQALQKQMLKCIMTSTVRWVLFLKFRSQMLRNKTWLPTICSAQHFEYIFFSRRCRR